MVMRALDAESSSKHPPHLYPSIDQTPLRFSHTQKKTAAFIIVAKPAIRQGGRGVLAKDDQPLLRPSFPSLMSTNSPGAFVAWRRKGRRCIEGKETRERRRKEGVDGYKQHGKEEVR